MNGSNRSANCVTTIANHIRSIKSQQLILHDLQIKFAFVDDIEINVNANLSKLQLTTAPSHHHHHQLLMLLFQSPIRTNEQ